MSSPSQDVTDSKFTDFEEYVKTVPIQARRMEVPFSVRTLERVEEGRCGDWLAVGAAGERYIIRDEIFKKTYALAPARMEQDINRGRGKPEFDQDIIHPPFKLNCPFKFCPTECKSPIFATGFHTCSNDYSTVICFNFRDKLLLSVVVDSVLAKDLMEQLKTDFTDESKSQEGGQKQ